MKTNHFLSLIFVCLTILPSRAENAPDTAFFKLYSYGKLNVFAEQVIQANDEGLIFLANANDTRSSDTTVIFLHKLNENGQRENTLQIALQDAGLWATSIVATHEKDGYIITGVYDAFESGWYADYFIIKITNSGDLVWKNIYEGECEQEAQSIIQTPDGNYIVIGSTQDAEPEPCFGFKIFSQKINGSGGTLWFKTYANEDYCKAYKIEKTTDGYMILGDRLKNQMNAFVIKLNESGDSIFTRTFKPDGYNYVFPHDMVVAENGDFFVIGNVTNTLSPELYDVVLMRVASNGNLKWSKAYNFSQQTGDVGIGIRKGVDNTSLFMTGTCNIDKLAVVSDYFLMKTDTAGNEIWNKELTDYLETSIVDMFKTEEAIYLCGTNDISVEIIPFLTKFEVSVTIQIDLTSFDPTKLTITTSPHNTVNITILSSVTSNALIEIFDLAGHKVYGIKNLKLSNDCPNEINISGLNNGLYICRCILGNEIVTKKFLVPEGQ